MFSGALWENNPVYCCNLKVKKGHFKSLCDNALESVGLLMFESRLSAFDQDHIETDCGFEASPESTQVQTLSEQGPVNTGINLNLILAACEKISAQLEAMETPKTTFLMDDDFLKLCASADALFDEFEDSFELASSLDNNQGTDFVASVSNIDASISNFDISTAYSDSTLPDTSNEDTSSEASDVTAWKWDIYMSAFDECDFLIYNYNDPESEVHLTNIFNLNFVLFVFFKLKANLFVD